MLEDENLKNSLIVSACLHVGMLLFVYFGAPTLFKPIPLEGAWHPIPVDIVEIGDITNTRINGMEEGSSAPPPSESAKKPQPKVAEAKPSEVKPPEPVKTPPAKPEAKTAEAKEEVTDEAALPQPKAKPKPPAPPKQQAQQQDQLDSLLKNISKLKATTAPDDDKKQADAKSEAKPASTTGTAAGSGGIKAGSTAGGFGPALSDRLTISAEDALRRQISSCWNMPIGARNAEDLIVEVVIEVNPDRTVKSAEVADQSRMGSDPYFRAAAESALRALRNPRCSPLELPPDEYDRWKVIRFNFDPRDML